MHVLLASLCCSLGVCVCIFQFCIELLGCSIADSFKPSSSMSVVMKAVFWPLHVLVFFASFLFGGELEQDKKISFQKYKRNGIRGTK